MRIIVKNKKYVIKLISTDRLQEKDFYSLDHSSFFLFPPTLDSRENLTGHCPRETQTGKLCIVYIVITLSQWGKMFLLFKSSYLHTSVKRNVILRGKRDEKPNRVQCK